MNLGLMAKSLKSFVGVSRKTNIVEITRKMQEVFVTTVPFNAKVIESFGEDCAVIDIGDKERYLLFKIEEMWHRLIDADPEFAGYCSVLVNVNDVTVKGGIPIAVVNTLAVASTGVRDKIVDGMIEGCKKFNVAIVGGHLSPDAPSNRLSVAMIGTVKKNSLIRSDTARQGDLIVVAVDLDGHFNRLFKSAWDTTTHKSKTEVEDRLKAMREIADGKLATSAKDISNPGLVGTLGMLLDASNAGGEINLTKIPKPPRVELEQWLEAYPGFGIVLTTKPGRADDCVSIFQEHGIASEMVGKVVDSRKLLITDGQSSTEVFDFRVDKLSGKP